MELQKSNQEQDSLRNGNHDSSDSQSKPNNKRPNNNLLNDLEGMDQLSSQQEGLLEQIRHSSLNKTVSNITWMQLLSAGTFSTMMVRLWLVRK